jgi:hypothetical protein
MLKWSLCCELGICLSLPALLLGGWASSHDRQLRIIQSFLKRWSSHYFELRTLNFGVGQNGFGEKDPTIFLPYKGDHIEWGRRL